MQTVFLGNCLEVLRVLHSETRLRFVVMEKSRLSPTIQNFCSSNNIPLSLAETKRDIESLLKDGEARSATCFVANFGIILSEKVIHSFRKVINFHTGDIITCRGRHPLHFAILAKLPTMGVTAHFINSEEIDAGPIIAQIAIPINYNLTFHGNEKIMLSTLESFCRMVLSLISSSDFAPWAWFDTNPSGYNRRLDNETLISVYSSACLKEFL